MSTPRSLAVRSAARSRSRGFALREVIIVLVIRESFGDRAIQDEQRPGDAVDARSISGRATSATCRRSAMTQASVTSSAFLRRPATGFLDSAGNPVVHPATVPTRRSPGVRGHLVLTFAPAGGNALGFDGRGIPYSVTTPATFNNASRGGDRRADQGHRRLSRSLSRTRRAG